MHHRNLVSKTARTSAKTAELTIPHLISHFQTYLPLKCYRSSKFDANKHIFPFKCVPESQANPLNTASAIPGANETRQPRLTLPWLLISGKILLNFIGHKGVGTGEEDSVSMCPSQKMKIQLL